MSERRPVTVASRPSNSFWHATQHDKFENHAHSNTMASHAYAYTFYFEQLLNLVNPSAIIQFTTNSVWLPNCQTCQIDTDGGSHSARQTRILSPNIGYVANTDRCNALSHSAIRFSSNQWRAKVMFIYGHASWRYILLLIYIFLLCSLWNRYTSGARCTGVDFLGEPEKKWMK